MPSMSYCMFENTVIEMRQIINTMIEADVAEDLDLSSSEQTAYQQLIELCREFLEEDQRLASLPEDTSEFFGEP